MDNNQFRHLTLKSNDYSEGNDYSEVIDIPKERKNKFLKSALTHILSGMLSTENDKEGKALSSSKLRIKQNWNQMIFFLKKSYSNFQNISF